MRRRLAAMLLAAALVAPRMAVAVEPDEVLHDAQLEARARDISTELRCLVCQNQSIDDSHAALARDLRLLVRERLTAGDSDAAVRNYLVARYGDFILLKPPFNTETALLWGLPFLLLAGGGMGLLLARRRPDAVGRTVPLSGDERAEIDRLVGSQGG